MLSRASARLPVRRNMYRIAVPLLVVMIALPLAIHDAPERRESRAAPAPAVEELDANAAELPAEEEPRAALNPERSEAPAATSREPVTLAISPDMTVIGWPAAGSVVDLLLVGKDRRTLMVENAQVIATPALSAFGRCTGSADQCAVQLAVTPHQQRSILGSGPYAKASFKVRVAAAAHGPDTIIIQGRPVEPGARRALPQVNGRRTFTLSSGGWSEAETGSPS